MEGNVTLPTYYIWDGDHMVGEIFPLDIVLYHLFKDHGLKLRNRIIWHFEHGLHCTNRLSGRHETILWFTKSDGREATKPLCQAS